MAVCMINRSRSDDQKTASEAERLLQENRDLKSRLNILTSAFADLERRMHRLESSVIFRFLRWLGPRRAEKG